MTAPEVGAKVMAWISESHHQPVTVTVVKVLARCRRGTWVWGRREYDNGRTSKGSAYFVPDGPTF